MKNKPGPTNQNLLCV